MEVIQTDDGRAQVAGLISYFQGLPRVPFQRMDLYDTIDFMSYNAKRSIIGPGGPAFIWNMESPFSVAGNNVTIGEGTSGGAADTTML